MRIEEMCEPVEVIALFRQGHVAPLKFRWRDRVYRILRINGDWHSEEGATRFHNFAVLSEGPDVFHLSYNERAHTWKMEKVSVEG